MSFLDKSINDHVMILTMSSPETRNALTSDEQFGEFEDVCVEINDDKSVRAVVLTGEGSAFCAGGNVKDMRERKGLLAEIHLTRLMPIAKGYSAYHERSIP